MVLQLEERNGVRIAVEGCGHGLLHSIYSSVTEACKQKGWPDVDLLIIGGDFQAARNGYDLNCINMPAKYRSMCDFHEYYSGQRTALYLTLFVGGNHEASNHLFELYYGGWVAPKIYYMGAANVLRFGPLRIAGLSGIWKGYNYRKPHHERLPYNESDMRSIYHVRELDVRKLLQIRTQVDIGISHDWPKGVEWKGNWKQLFRNKKHLEDDARNGQLGSVAARLVMDWLRPDFWFSAHLHCKYAAVIDHEKKDDPQQPLPIASASSAAPAKNEDEIQLDDDIDIADTSVMNSGTGTLANGNEIDLELDEEDDISNRTTNHASSAVQGAQKSNGTTLPSLEDARAALPDSFRRPEPPEQVEHLPAINNKITRFLALDKCLPRKDFLQLIAIPTETETHHTRPLHLGYDREWLAITRAFALNEPLLLGDPNAIVTKIKSPAEYGDMIEKQAAWIDEHISDSDMVIPDNFEVTAPEWDGADWNLPQYGSVIEHPNPQTAKFCEMLDLPNPFDLDDEERHRRLAAGPRFDPGAGQFGGGRGRGGFNHRGGRGGGRGRGRGRGGSHGRFSGR